VRPTLGINLRGDGLADPEPAVQRAAMDDEATQRSLRVRDRSEKEEIRGVLR